MGGSRVQVSTSAARTERAQARALAFPKFAAGRGPGGRRNQVGKSRAAVPEQAVHDALALIEGGGAIAFDLRQPAEYYFRPGAGRIDQRLLEGLTDLAPGAADALHHALATTPLFFELRDAHGLLCATVEASEARQSLRTRRFVVVHAGHVLFDAGMILDHAGSQARSGVGPGLPTIYLPLELLRTAGRAAQAARPGLQRLLEHADFHLRGDPDAVIIAGHPFSSTDEHAHIEQLWEQHRRALLDLATASLDLLDAEAAAYWATVLYLLGAADIVLADTVPMILQTVESTGDELCGYLPQLHATFREALADQGETSGEPAARFKIAVFPCLGRSVTSILAAHAIALEGVDPELIDRPSAGLVAIRRTLDQGALLELERVLGQLPAGRNLINEALVLLADHAGGDDLARALVHLTAAQSRGGDAGQLADDFLLNRHEAALLARFAQAGPGVGVLSRVT